jgi:hypothetical protein
MSRNKMNMYRARDPYEIERLADELAAREAANPPSEPPDDSPNSVTDILPLYTPLSHDNPYLAAEHFDVEEFLLSRAHTSLQDLRAELRDYLSTLKEALVKLINDDYEAFISLSTDLRGEGPRLEKLKYPLSYLRAQILVRVFTLRNIPRSIDVPFCEDVEGRVMRHSGCHPREAG